MTLGDPWRASSASGAALSQDALQKENSRLADANHALSAQLSHVNAQRSEAQAKWAEREKGLRSQLAAMQVPALHPWLFS